MKKKMTHDEMRKLAAVLEKIETETYAQTGLHKISGGFAEASVVDFDKLNMEVMLRFGVRDGEEDRVNTERFLVSRRTLVRVER